MKINSSLFVVTISLLTIQYCFSYSLIHGGKRFTFQPQTTLNSNNNNQQHQHHHHDPIINKKQYTFQDGWGCNPRSSTGSSSGSNTILFAAAPATAGGNTSGVVGPKDTLNKYKTGTDASRFIDNRRDAIEVTMKFGGSSLANSERVDHVAHLIKEQIEAGYRPRAVICSAMGKTTNSLLSAGEFALDGRVNIDAIKTLHLATVTHFNMSQNVYDEVSALLNECEALLTGVRLIQEMSPKSLDQLVSYGERCSVRIMAGRLNQIGVPAQAFDAWDVGVLTDSDFGNAKILPESDDAIRAAFDKIDKNIVAVVTGFIGHDKNGKITTLGRSGSDLSATQIGASLGVDEIQVWKDVDGILSSDPRVIPNAIPISEVTYEEASELAYFGAQVLHPTAMRPAIRYDVPVRVKNSYNPDAVGSYIRNKRSDEIRRLVTAITFKRGIKLMDIRSTEMLGTYGFLAEVFKAFQHHRLSVDVLASSEVSISLTLDKQQNVDEINGLIEDLCAIAEITIEEKKSILTLITDVQRSSEVLATVFRVFSTEGIKVEMMSQGASKVNISFIVDDKDLDRAAIHLHKCFFEDKCAVEPFSVNKGNGSSDSIVTTMNGETAVIMP